MPAPSLSPRFNLKSIEIPIICAKTLPLILAFSLSTWALVRHGQRPLGEIGTLCQERQHIDTLCKNRQQQSIGFQGDADFYGLGIRLGLYLQWASSFITNWFTPMERPAFVITYVIFNLSITIAVLVRVFGQQCTFVAEIFVVLTLFWGGLNVVLLVPLLRGITLNATMDITLPKNRDSIRMIQTSPSLKWASNLLNCFMSPVTIWFWVRLAAVGQQDFGSTPGQTSLFFFARIQRHGVKTLSIFMSVASVFNFLWFSWILFPLRGPPNDEDLEDDSFEVFLCELVWVPLTLLMWPLYTSFNVVTLPTLYFMGWLMIPSLTRLLNLISLARKGYRQLNPKDRGNCDRPGPVGVAGEMKALCLLR